MGEGDWESVKRLFAGARAQPEDQREVAALLQDLSAVAVTERRSRRARRLVAAVLTLAAGLALTWSWFDRRPPPVADAGGARIMLAVLPFANQSGDPRQDYLSDGLTDELITELGRLHPERLGVIARTSAVRYQQTRGEPSRIARELGVEYFIEGSAARAGTTLRIGVRLARAGDQTQVWAERYERELNDVLRLQADIARSIAREVAVVLTPERSAQLDARRAIDPAAVEHYLKGRYFWSKRTEEGLTRAVAEFEAATRKHPGYAAAHAGIADSYLLLAYYSYLPPDQAFGRAPRPRERWRWTPGSRRRTSRWPVSTTTTTTGGRTPRRNTSKRCASTRTTRPRTSGTPTT